MSKSTISTSKPLKGTSVSGNLGTFDVLEANNLIISGETVSQLLNGVQMVGVSVLDGEINNTIIGANNPNEGFFTRLSAVSDVFFYSITKSKYVSWDSKNGILGIIGNFSVQGCATISNLSICNNTISAINYNGDISLIPNTLGTIILNGPINNTTSLPGNYLTNLASGNVTFISSDYISLTSISSGMNVTTFSNQVYTTINGDITLNTESELSSKPVSLISAVNGNIQVTTSVSSKLRIGDTITLSNTNSIPKFNGIFVVTFINSTNSFNISTGNTFTGITSNSTTGNFIKTPSNNINLNASLNINIPKNIPLMFGNTENSISGNTSGIILSTQKDLVLNIPGNLILDSNKIIIGTSGNEFIKFDNNTTSIISTNINLTTTNTINLNGINTFINTQKLLITDQNPIIANYNQTTTDLTDRGIQFNYYDKTTNSSKLGWFGYKQNSSKFTLLVNAVNNNDVFTGMSGKFDIGDITTTSITLNPNSFIDLNNGNLLNTNNIFGSNGILNLNANNRISLLPTGDIYIPNNIPITFGTAGTFIKEGTTANLRLTAANNIFLSTNTLGSIVIQPNIKLSFDGTSIGNQNINSDTFGNLNINTNNNLFINTRNIILPNLIPIQFGGVTQKIQGNTGGIFINSESTLGNINLVANSNINISTSFGSISLNSTIGDIQLYSTTGNIRLLQLSRIVFGINNTTNSIRTNSNGNMTFNGPGNTILNGTIGNLIEFKNTSIINLSGTVAVNIPTNSKLTLDNNNNRYFVSDTNSNLLIVNNESISNVIINSLNTTINNTKGITSIINTNTNITSSNFTISGSLINLNSLNVKTIDPILTIANYTTIDNKDRGIEFNYYSTMGSLKLGWFGLKSNSNEFTFYSDAINTNEVISGTLGQFMLGSAMISTSLSFSSQGNLNMNNGTISNLNTVYGNNLNILSNSNINITSSNGNVNITSSNVNLYTNKVLLPYNSLLSFGNTQNSLSSDTNGNIMLNASSAFVINSNVQINGTMNSVYSTTTVYQDSILSIGGVNGPVINDLKDRGIEFKWNNGNSSKTGFFGFQNSSKRFIFMTDDINNNEVISGSFGNVQFNNGYFNNLELNCGTISNVSVLNGCANNLSIVSNNINLSSSNIIIPSNSKLSFTNTNNSINSDTNGNLIISNNLNTIISSNVLFNTNTNGNGFTTFNVNSKIYFGYSNFGNYLLRDTNSNFNINNSSGDIYLTPLNNVIIPVNNNLIFGNLNTKIYSNGSNGSNLQLYGNTISINTSYSNNSTNSVILNGNVNINGSLVSIDNGKYIYPLGTKQQLSIVNIVNSTTQSYIDITTNINHYFSIGDKININNTNSTPVIYGIFTVTQIISNLIFSISFSSTLTTNGNSGIIYSNLKSYQGKDIGIQIDYWSTIGNTTITSGSTNFKQAFFGWINDTQQFTYYNNATIENNIITKGTLGDIKINKLNTNNISGFTLDGDLIGNNHSISTSNLQANGGTINGIPIGSTIAQNGKFTNLTSSISSSLQNVTINSNLNYSIDRFTLSSSFKTQNPSINTISSCVTVIGITFISNGIMQDGLYDGQIKNISISSIGIDCQYILIFNPGKLIAPGTGIPSKLTFKSKGQSAQLMWDIILQAWSIIGGNGALVS